MRFSRKKEKKRTFGAPKGSRAFLQNKFQCPPMVGVYRT
jgi:hypothetical protein